MFRLKVLGDDPRQAARVAEVSEHYHHLGGTSPFNELTADQADALEAELAARGTPMPVRCGFRNWPPWYSDGLRELAEAGCDAILPVPLSAQVSSRGWGDYLEEAAAALEDLRSSLGDATPSMLPAIEPFGIQPTYAQACAAQISDAVTAAGWSEERLRPLALVCTAHAIPVPAERASPYRGTRADRQRSRRGLPAP